MVIITTIILLIPIIVSIQTIKYSLSKHKTQNPLIYYILNICILIDGYVLELSTLVLFIMVTSDPYQYSNNRMIDVVINILHPLISKLLPIINLVILIITQNKKRMSKRQQN